jgi:hypothetical protein
VHLGIILLQQQRKEYKTQKLLAFEIRGLQDELAAFIMDEVLTKKGSFSIQRTKDKSVDQEMKKFYCNIFIFIVIYTLL